MLKYFYFFSSIVFLCACNDEQPVIQPTLTGFEPAAAGRCEWVRITGSLFDSIATNNEVRFNGVLAAVEFANDSVLLVRVPEDAQTGPIEVATGGQILTSTEQFTLLKGHWRQLPDFPGPSRFQATGFVINDKIYFGLGTINGFNYGDFWEYDPASGIWTQKADYPGGPINSAVGFELNGKGYFGLGTDNLGRFFEYDPANDIWLQKADFPKGIRNGAFAFTLNNKAYIGGGFSDALTNLNDNSFWQFDPLMDIWAEVPSSPTGVQRFGAVAFQYGGKGFMGFGGYPSFKDFQVFDPTMSTWSALSVPPLVGSYETWLGSAMMLNDKAYIRLSHQFWSYEPSSNVWSQVAAPCGNPARSEVGLAAGGKIFLICGLGQPRFPEVADLPSYINWNSKQVWEFTPED